jgi:hypothetical protein
MLFKGNNNLFQIYRSFSITGNYGRRSFSKYARLLLEAKSVAQQQIVDSMLKDYDPTTMTGNTLHSDATSKFFKHYESFQVTLPEEIQRGPIRHNGAKKKLQLKHKNSLFTLQTFHYNYY